MDALKELVFSEGLLESVLRDTKLITIRKYRTDAHDFVKDEIIVGVFEEGMNILLHITADTEKKFFHELTDAEVQEDGFDDTADALSDLRLFYDDLTEQSEMAIIRFEILKHSGTPVVSFNKFVEYGACDCAE